MQDGDVFLCKLKTLEPEALAILNAGAFSVGRTDKPYSRTAVDLTLEQTVNKDASSPMKGICAFRNSESAFRRWAITLTQRGMALTELKSIVGMQEGEQPLNQLRPWRIERDNSDMLKMQNVLMGTCNPFENTKELVNLATEKTAETKSYLLATLERGVQNRLKFESECKDDGSRFQKLVGKTKVLNFAAENVKLKSLPYKN